MVCRIFVFSRQQVTLATCKELSCCQINEIVQSVSRLDISLKNSRAQMGAARPDYLRLQNVIHFLLHLKRNILRVAIGTHARPKITRAMSGHHEDGYRVSRLFLAYFYHTFCNCTMYVRNSSTP